jgi:hypothetical protein
VSDLQTIQQFVLFSLVIGQPTLRKQNFELVILDKVENPKTAKHNAIVFEENRVVLQYSKFKTHS